MAWGLPSGFWVETEVMQKVLEADGGGAGWDLLQVSCSTCKADMNKIMSQLGRGEREEEEEH